MAARLLSLLLVVFGAVAAAPAAFAATPGPNGRIVFASTRDGSSNYELYSAAADGTGATRLTWSWTIEQQPAWSPDGALIAFGSFAEGRQSIHVMKSDGSGERRLSPDASNTDDMEPSWSPDGSQIAFASTRPWNESWHVWVINADGSGLRQVTSEFSTGPAWSPDGGRIAYLRADGSIAVSSLDGSGARRVTAPPAGYSDERPSWTPDGTRLVFARRATYGNAPQLYVVDADGTGERQLTFGDGANRAPSWSPDGTRIAFTHDQQLYVISVDGSGMAPLGGGAGDVLAPDWGTSTAVPAPQVPGAPRIQILSPEPRAYLAGQDVPAIYQCQSDTSPVVACEGDVPFGSLVDTETTGRRTFTVRATDAEGRTSTATTTFDVIDWHAPTLRVRAPADGAEYALGAAVSVDYECIDERGGSGIELCGGELLDGQPLDTSRTGSFTVHFWAVDRARNITEAAVTYRVVNPDHAAPTIAVDAPAEGASYLVGATVSASYSCTDEPGGSGVEMCRGDAPSGAPLDTGSVGTHSFTVHARDRAGNSAAITHAYAVVYPFSGFFAPLAPRSPAATLAAGETVPVKFSLSGNRGVAILAAGSPSWTPVDCRDGTILGPGSPARGTLSYSGGTDRYLYLADTAASWAGSCRQITVTLDDGTRHSATVTFAAP